MHLEAELMQRLTRELNAEMGAREKEMKAVQSIDDIALESHTYDADSEALIM
jgi:hypothetical protein